VTCQARIDASWHHSSPSARECTEIYRGPKSAPFEVKLLPGGHTVVIISAEGSVDLRSTASMEELPRAPLFQAQICEYWRPIEPAVILSEVFCVSESDGYIVLELYHNHMAHRWVTP
jgi:hypothetical protein